MARKKWRTVSCDNDSLRAHSTQPQAYLWVARRPAGERFRVQYDEQLGGGWCSYATVRSLGNGKTDEE